MTNIDDTTASDAPGRALADMSEDELQAAMNGMAAGGNAEEGEPAEETPEATPEESQEAEAATPSKVIMIGDEEYEEALAAELISKGKGFTQKTQKLAAREKEVEGFEQILQTWDTMPQMRQAILTPLAAEAGFDLVPKGQSQSQAQTRPSNSEQDDVDTSDLSDDALIVYHAGKKREAAQADRIASLEAKLNQLIEGQTQTQKLDTAATSAAESLRENYGVKATPEQVREAMKATGNPDGEAAWLKVNAKELIKAVQTRAAAQVVTEKPNAPGPGGAKSFDPMAKDKEGNFIYGPAKAAKLMQEGYTPVPGS